MNTRQQQQAQQRARLRREAAILSSDASDTDKIAALVALGYNEAIARMMLEFRAQASNGVQR